MRKAFYLSVILLFVMASCSNEKGSGVKIGFLIHSRSNARWVTDINYLTARSNEVGAELIIKDAEGDENIQLKQAHELIELGVDVLIVVAANQNTAGGIVREAHDNGVKVISYDRMIKNSDLDYLISFEYEKVGEEMVDYVAERVPGGNCIVLWGDANDANAVFIKNGQQRALGALSNNNQLNVVYKSYVENWNGKTSKQIVDKVLDFSSDKIDAVVSSNIPLAIGACESLAEHGYKPNEVVVTSMDATIVMVHSMLNGGITMTVTKPIEKLANGAIDLAMDIVTKKNNIVFEKTVFNGRKEVPAKLFAPIVIDISNFEAELIEKGYFTREEVYNKN